MPKKLLFMLCCGLMCVATGCKQETDMSELNATLTDIVNIKYEGYSPEKHDALIDTAFTPELASEVKDYFLNSDSKDTMIPINDIMEQAEQDRYNDVVVEAYKRGVGFVPKEGHTAYDDEIYQSYHEGKLDNLKNTNLDSRIEVKDGKYSVPLEKVKDDPELTGVMLSIYGHEYVLDLSEYRCDWLYLSNPEYKYRADGYALYSDGTFEIDFITDTEGMTPAEDFQTHRIRLSGRATNNRITEITED